MKIEIKRERTEKNRSGESQEENTKEVFEKYRK